MGLIMSTYVTYFQSKEKYYNTLVVGPSFPILPVEDLDLLFGTLIGEKIESRAITQGSAAVIFGMQKKKQGQK